MASEKQSPGTVAQSDPLSACSWSSINYAKTSDNLRAKSELYSIDSTSDSLIATDFNFSVPEGATIDGIEIALECRANPTTAIDTVCTLRNAGANIGNSQNDRLTWPANDAVKYIGGESDKWGATLTPAICNGAGFGVALYLTDNAAGTIAEIDSIAITVYYTTSSANITEFLTFSATAAIEPATDLGGNTFTETLTFSAGATMSGGANVAANEDLAFSTGALMFSGHDKEQSGVRIISASNDYSIDYAKIHQLIEVSKRDFQVNKYGDGHNRIYLKSSWRKTWTLTIWPSDTHKTLITALRSETGDLRLFPLYKYDKSTFYKCRVDPRAPLYYHSGQGDAETLLTLIFYETA